VNFSWRSNQDVEIDPLDKDPLEPVQVDSDDAQVQKNLMHTALAFFTGGRTREIHRVKNYDMVCSKERGSYSTTPKFHSSPLKSSHPLEGEDRLPSIIFLRFCVKLPGSTNQQGIYQMIRLAHQGQRVV